MEGVGSDALQLRLNGYTLDRARMWEKALDGGHREENACSNHSQQRADQHGDDALPHGPSVGRAATPMLSTPATPQARAGPRPVGQGRGFDMRQRGGTTKEKPA